MAKDPPVYDPARRYRVRLARPVTILGARLLPIDDHEMDGGTLTAIGEREGADSVEAAEPL